MTVYLFWQSTSWLLFVSPLVCFCNVNKKNTKTVVLFYHKNLFMFECDFQSTNILLLKMTYNINQTQYKKKEK